jgi:hypothetical protein
MVWQLSHEENQVGGRQEVTAGKRKSGKQGKSEVTSGRIFLFHLRAAQVSPHVARSLFEKYGLDWIRFTKEGVKASKLIATGDAIALKIADVADAEERPIDAADGEVRVFMRHVRAAELCKKGSQAFFRKHGLDYRDFLKNGIAVSKLEEIGDPIALRAAHEAIERERNGRR